MEWPHMCQDGHEAIGWRGNGELCPMCKLVAKLEAAAGMRAAIEALRRRLLE